MGASLTRKADRELEEIIHWGVEHFGRAAAVEYANGMLRLFNLLASTPRMAREIGKGMRAHPYRSHIVVYRERQDGIEVLHIRHGHSNWRKYL